MKDYVSDTKVIRFLEYFFNKVVNYFIIFLILLILIYFLKLNIIKLYRTT